MHRETQHRLAHQSDTPTLLTQENEVATTCTVPHQPLPASGDPELLTCAPNGTAASQPVPTNIPVAAVADSSSSKTAMDDIAPVSAPDFPESAPPQPPAADTQGSLSVSDTIVVTPAHPSPPVLGNDIPAPPQPHTDASITVATPIPADADATPDEPAGSCTARETAGAPIVSEATIPSGVVNASAASPLEGIPSLQGRLAETGRAVTPDTPATSVVPDPVPSPENVHADTASVATSSSMPSAPLTCDAAVSLCSVPAAAASDDAVLQSVDAPQASVALTLTAPSSAVEVGAAALLAGPAPAATDPVELAFFTPVPGAVLGMPSPLAPTAAAMAPADEEGPGREMALSAPVDECPAPATELAPLGADGVDTAPALRGEPGAEGVSAVPAALLATAPESVSSNFPVGDTPPSAAARGDMAPTAPPVASGMTSAEATVALPQGDALPAQQAPASPVRLSDPSPTIAPVSADTPSDMSFVGDPPTAVAPPATTSEPPAAPGAVESAVATDNTEPPTDCASAEPITASFEPPSTPSAVESLIFAAAVVTPLTAAPSSPAARDEAIPSTPDSAPLADQTGPAATVGVAEKASAPTMRDNNATGDPDIAPISLVTAALHAATAMGNPAPNVPTTPAVLNGAPSTAATTGGDEPALPPPLPPTPQQPEQQPKRSAPLPTDAPGLVEPAAPDSMRARAAAAGPAGITRALDEAASTAAALLNAGSTFAMLSAPCSPQSFSPPPQATTIPASASSPRSTSLCPASQPCASTSPQTASPRMASPAQAVQAPEASSAEATRPTSCEPQAPSGPASDSSSAGATPAADTGSKAETTEPTLIDTTHDIPAIPPPALATLLPPEANENARPTPHNSGADAANLPPPMQQPTAPAPPSPPAAPAPHSPPAVSGVPPDSPAVSDASDDDTSSFLASPLLGRRPASASPPPYSPPRAAASLVPQASCIAPHTPPHIPLPNQAVPLSSSAVASTASVDSDEYACRGDDSVEDDDDNDSVAAMMRGSEMLRTPSRPRTSAQVTQTPPQTPPPLPQQPSAPPMIAQSTAHTSLAETAPAIPATMIVAAPPPPPPPLQPQSQPSPIACVAAPTPAPAPLEAALTSPRSSPATDVPPAPPSQPTSPPCTLQPAVAATTTASTNGTPAEASTSLPLAHEATPAPDGEAPALSVASLASSSPASSVAAPTGSPRAETATDNLQAAPASAVSRPSSPGQHSTVPPSNALPVATVTVPKTDVVALGARSRMVAGAAINSPVRASAEAGARTTARLGRPASATRTPVGRAVGAQPLRALPHSAAQPMGAGRSAGAPSSSAKRPSTSAASTATAARPGSAGRGTPSNRPASPGVAPRRPSPRVTAAARAPSPRPAAHPASATPSFSSAGAPRRPASPSVGSVRSAATTTAPRLTGVAARPVPRPAPAVGRSGPVRALPLASSAGPAAAKTAAAGSPEPATPTERPASARTAGKSLKDWRSPPNLRSVQLVWCAPRGWACIRNEGRGGFLAGPLRGPLHTGSIRVFNFSRS